MRELKKKTLKENIEDFEKIMKVARLFVNKKVGG